MEQVTMPKLGLTMTEGTVSQDEVLLVVATDKLTYEVVSPIDGAVLEILVNERRARRRPRRPGRKRKRVPNPFRRSLRSDPRFWFRLQAGPGRGWTCREQGAGGRRPLRRH